jgi:hypothetical protein
MDTKHVAMEVDVKSSVPPAVGLVAPPVLEYQLLSRRQQLMADDLAKAGGSSEVEAEVGYLSKWGSTIAMCDLQGQTAPDMDWYREQEFVCMHCLQPCRGIPIGYPLSAQKCVEDGRTLWVVTGRFGSVGCALRYATDNRYTFHQETAGLLPVMLFRVYGFKGDVTAIPIAPNRTSLIPFQPTLCRKWAAGEIKFDPYTFHDAYRVKLHLPDPKKHCIVNYRASLLIDAQVARDKLGFKAPHLQRMLPNLYTKPRSNNPTIGT